MRKTVLLKELKNLLNDYYPGVIDKVILFGSQAKGKVKSDSDYDILVVLRTKYDWKLENKIIDTCYKIDLKYNILTDIKITSDEELNTLVGQQPFIQQAMKYGIAI
jgi:predicted nucleotidyltransferase